MRGTQRAVRAGASPADLGKALAYAAALRVARFGTANEHGDWETAHHVFTYANAIHQADSARIATGEPDTLGLSRPCAALLHGAMALYLARYLNVPSAALPGEAGDRLDELPTDPGALRAALLDAFDRHHQVDAAARLVARYLLLGHPAAGSDRDARPRPAPRGCGLSRLPDAGSRRAAVSGVGQGRGRSAYPRRGGALSRRPRADRAHVLADRGHRAAADARRPAPRGGRGRLEQFSIQLGVA